MNLSFVDFIKSVFLHGFDLTKRSYAAIFPAAFLFGVVIQLIISFAPPFGEENVATASILALVVVVVSATVNAWMLYAIAARGQGTKPSTMQLLRPVMARWLPIISATILFNLGIGLCVYLFPLLALLFGAFFFLYLPVLLFEPNQTILGSFVRSTQLAWPQIIGVFIMYAINIAIYLGPNMIVAFLPASSPTEFGIDKVVGIFATAMTLPITCNICVTCYSLLQQGAIHKTK